MKVSIVVPTYNEAENIKKLIPLLDSVLKDYNHEIIIVDDNSPDGTAEVAKKLTEKYPVKVIVREKKLGLASAILEGIKSARAELVVVMDADLQHPPEYVLELLKNSNGYDIVIASRYVKGGEIEGWSIFRKVISKGASLLAKIMLPKIRKIKDPESGFFLVRRSKILAIADKINPTGFKFLLEVLCVGDFKVKEIPYTFRPREHGKSKFNFKEVINYIKLLLRLSDYRVIKFGIVGATGIVVNEGLLYILVLLGCPLYIASLVAIESSILSNFILNDLWTFKDRKEGSFISRCLKYHGAVALGAVVNFITLLALVSLGVHYLIANLIGISLGFVVNYIGSEVVVWSRWGRNF
ncbi:glycosyltransferase [Methanotorris igneus]|uniref:Dolichyl-phosphate beta-D-mannosyltransferase n=1 Tax=Methanotorris igneus (strain DSM 5666 / JCM 11834 / Kol 5) TaxID=880724 RepID=F6BBC6_METIK|nr:glycosyltransferase family 2 protein [Methanotorris igneus]AEF97133.1 Dolichyl-phosphate beta-D-mannosyltransferase [Methanotorris igneus Kol 5]